MKIFLCSWLWFRLWFRGVITCVWFSGLCVHFSPSCVHFSPSCVRFSAFCVHRPFLRAALAALRALFASCVRLSAFACTGLFCMLLSDLCIRTSPFACTSPFMRALLPSQALPTFPTHTKTPLSKEWGS